MESCISTPSSTICFAPPQARGHILSGSTHVTRQKNEVEQVTFFRPFLKCRRAFMSAVAIIDLTEPHCYGVETDQDFESQCFFWCLDVGSSERDFLSDEDDNPVRSCSILPAPFCRPHSVTTYCKLAIMLSPSNRTLRSIKSAACAPLQTCMHLTLKSPQQANTGRCFHRD